ncbi:MAG: hypothetical protein ABI418_04990, partial [Jatrophihabitantaceae bacterium]
ESVLNQLRATYEAAIADEGAEAAVRSGRLTSALSYSGFGEVDVSDAVAIPRRLTLVPQLPAGVTPEATEQAASTESADGATESAGSIEAVSDPAAVRLAERGLKQAESALAVAAEAAATATERLAETQAGEQRLADRIQQLQADLVTARAEAATAAKATATAERELARSTRALERAERAQRLAEAALRSLGS